MDRRLVPVLLVLAVALAGTVAAIVDRDDGASEAAFAAPPTAAPTAQAAGGAPSSGDGSSGSGGEAKSGIVEVVIEQRNNPIFDLIPTVLNGASIVDQFDERNENNLDEPLTIPAGEIHFKLQNVGTLAHNFQVRLLDGTNLKKTRNVGPRRTGELVITLEPGTYLIACPISDHDQRGMLRTLIVTAGE